MIRAVIVMSTQGKPRLTRFYDYQSPERQQELIRSVYGVLSGRAENVSNFAQTEAIFGPMHTIVDEIVLGGQVLETSSDEVMKAVEEITKLEKSTNAIGPVPKSFIGRFAR